MTPEVTCAKNTATEYLQETPLIWIISMGHDIMASLLPFVIHMQNLSY